MIYKINEGGIFIEIYPFNDIPLSEVDGEKIPDPTFVKEPIPNAIHTEMGVSPKWTGTEWIATAEPPEPLPQLPNETDRLDMLELAILDLMME